MRVGIGYDLHRLVEDSSLILGGIRIPHDRGLAGHSDADALTHAIIDALLGAAALGNIGRMFPDTDEAYRGANSIQLLSKTAELLHTHGYTIANIDSNIVAQQPKLNPYLDAMRENLAATLGISAECVSVKVKTNEEVGPEGRGEAISTQAVALIVES